MDNQYIAASCSHVWVLILTIFLRQCQEVHSHRHTKCWFSYIKKLLSSQLETREKQGVLEQTFLSSWLNFFSKSSKRFCRRANTIYLQKYDSASGSDSKFITTPLGQLLFDTSIRLCRIKCFLFFRLHTQLWLNISLVQIYFASKAGFIHRSAGQLHLNNFILSGIHSLLELNFKSNITLSVFAKECFHIKILYCITDEQTIYTMGDDYSESMDRFGGHQTKSLQTLDGYIQQRTYFLILQLFFDKFKIVHIWVKRDTDQVLEIWDGPGILSKLLLPYYASDQFERFKTSTFQCKIFATGRPQLQFQVLQNYDRIYTIYARQNTTEIHILHILKKSSLNFVHIFYVLSPKQHSVKTTILKVSQKGRFSSISSYQYAGLSTYESNYNYVNETLSLYGFEYMARTNGSNLVICMGKEGDQKRNIHSDATMGTWIAVYAFSPYVEYFEAQVLLSPTKCKVIFINICEYKVTEEKTFRNVPGNKFIQIHHGECVVLHIRSKQLSLEKFKSVYCSLKIRPGTNLESRQLIIYNITGNFYYQHGKLSVYGYPDTFSYQLRDFNGGTSKDNMMMHRCIHSPPLQYFCLEAASLSSPAFSLNMSTTTFGDNNNPYIFIMLFFFVETGYVDLRFEIQNVSHKAKLPTFALFTHNDKNILTLASKKLLFEKDSILLVLGKSLLSLSNSHSKQWIEVNLSVDALTEQNNHDYKFAYWPSSPGYFSGPFAFNCEYILNISSPLTKRQSLVYLTQGNVKNLTYSCKISNNTCAFITNADLSWIKNSFGLYLQHNINCNRTCQCFDMIEAGSLLYPDFTRPYLFAYCINFSSVATWEHPFHFIFFRQAQDKGLVKPFHELQGIPGNVVLVSWKQASWMCKHIGGTLPVFRSRDELNQLLSFLKFSPVLPMLEAFFVGLF